MLAKRVRSRRRSCSRNPQSSGPSDTHTSHLTPPPAYPPPMRTNQHHASRPSPSTGGGREGTAPPQSNQAPVSPRKAALRRFKRGTCFSRENANYQTINNCRSTFSPVRSRPDSIKPDRVFKAETPPTQIHRGRNLFSVLPQKSKQSNAPQSLFPVPCSPCSPSRTLTAESEDPPRYESHRGRLLRSPTRPSASKSWTWMRRKRARSSCASPPPASATPTTT